MISSGFLTLVKFWIKFSSNVICSRICGPTVRYYISYTFYYIFSDSCCFKVMSYSFSLCFNLDKNFKNFTNLHMIIIEPAHTIFVLAVLSV